MPFFNKLNEYTGSDYFTQSSSNSLNNLVILISFIVIVYILVQMIIVLNNPKFLYYTYSKVPTDLYNKNESEELINDNNAINQEPISPYEYTFSFWLYLKKVSTSSSSTNEELIFYMGNKETSNQTSNPKVFFSKNTNKLNIQIRTTPLSSSNTGSNSNPNSECSSVDLEVEYFPLKRWTNVVFNVDNKRITLFINGNIYKTLLINNKCPNANVETVTGGIYIGSDNQPDALISKLQYYNHTLNSRDIRKIYDNGPIQNKSFLQKIGFPNLGFRTPIYNIDENTSE